MFLICRSILYSRTDFSPYHHSDAPGASGYLDENGLQERMKVLKNSNFLNKISLL